MSLDLKRKKMELARVEMARKEQEFKIDERMEEISRLQSMIEIQIAKEKELAAQIAELESKGE